MSIELLASRIETVVRLLSKLKLGPFWVRYSARAGLLAFTVRLKSQVSHDFGFLPRRKETEPLIDGDSLFINEDEGRRSVYLKIG
jgi:hypothetical protein